jgi:hypothetical protein
MMMLLRAMVLGRLGGFFTPIQEPVLYPSHRPPWFCPKVGSQLLLTTVSVPS